jgi:hypothetical protein
LVIYIVAKHSTRKYFVSYCILKIQVFWVVVPCSPVNSYQYFTCKVKQFKKCSHVEGYGCITEVLMIGVANQWDADDKGEGTMTLKCSQHDITTQKTCNFSISTVRAEIS